MIEVYGGHSVGEQFGQKELFSYAGLNKFRHHLWNWLCLSCGEIRGPSTISHLKRHERCEECSKKRENNTRWKGMGKIPGVYISQTKRDAEVRNLVYEITSADMWKQFQLQNGRCAYTNWKLSFGYKSETTASLDRIDSSAGYTLENIQWIHKDVNRMKTNFTEERFLQLVKSISLNLGF